MTGNNDDVAQSASVGSSRTPPKLLNEMLYEQWKKDVAIWGLLTDLPQKKQALAIHLSLSGRARAASSELTVDELNSDDGVKELIRKLDKIFLPDEGRRKFSAFCELYNLRRHDGVSINDFVSEFEHCYYKFKENDMTLPDPVMAFMLLASCGLDERDVQLVMSGVAEVSFKNMKDALKRIYGSSFNSSSMTAIKDEPIFESRDNDVYFNASKQKFGANSGRYAQSSRGQSSRGRSRPSRSNWIGGNSRGSRKMNPLDREGNVSRCRICDSKFHWASNCPDAYENRSNVGCIAVDKTSVNESDLDKDEAEVHLSLFIGYTEGTKQKSDKLNGLVRDCFNSALLDSGCSKTVCGEKWLCNYTNLLSEYDRQCIQVKPSDSSFTFGDGLGEKSMKRVVLPCYIGGKRSTIETDVVKCNIPLLLSKPAMKKGKMCLNFANDTLDVGGNTIKLQSSSSGHYLLPLSI